MAAKSEGKNKVKKRLAIVALCLVFFVGGWIFHNFYLTLGSSLKFKAVQRQQLRKILKLNKGKLSGVDIIEEKDMGSYSRRLLRFHWQGFSFDTYLLVPEKLGEKNAAILALHGHKTTKEDVVGIKQSRFNINFGLRLVNYGFVVLAPDIPFSENFVDEDLLGKKLIMSGSHVTGLRLSYLSSLLDYLSSLPFVDSKRVGCVGWSMGGGLAMYLAALDKRVKAVAISSYFGTYKDSLMTRSQRSTDNYIPGILSFGEMADVACLIAPKPLWLENAEQDPEFPQAAFMKGLTVLKTCYKGHEECLQWQLIPGDHSFKGEEIEEWFQRWL